MSTHCRQLPAPLGSRTIAVVNEEESPRVVLMLRESHPFKSVQGIGDLDFDDLTVIAGINGAGKTHLLQAIKEGAIRAFIDDILIDPAEIVLHDWTTFAVAEAREASLSEIKQRAENEWRQFQNQLRSGAVQQLLREARGTVGVGASDLQLLRACP